MRPWPHNRGETNELKVHERETILSLWKTGWSARRIARELGCNRETASRYIRLGAEPKPATPIPGNEGGGGSVSEGKPATLTPGNDEGGEAKPATPTPRIEAVAVATACEAARRNLSLCAAWRAQRHGGGSEAHLREENVSLSAQVWCPYSGSPPYCGFACGDQKHRPLRSVFRGAAIGDNLGKMYFISNYLQ